MVRALYRGLEFPPPPCGADLAGTYELCQEVALGVELGISRWVGTRGDWGDVPYHQVHTIRTVVLDTSTQAKDMHPTKLTHLTEHAQSKQGYRSQKATVDCRLIDTKTSVSKITWTNQVCW